jgi:hypothetical protein
MAKRDMKKALGASLKAEEQSVKSRFEKAEAALSRKVKSSASSELAADFDKVIRDSFTMPSSDYDLISVIRERCLGGRVSLTKSEVLRAGLLALQAMPDKELLKAARNVTKVKTGRPAGRNGSD